MNTQNTHNEKAKRPAEVAQIKLKPRTTYLNGRGQRVYIAGLARRDDCQHAYWSIQGDHYTEDGRLFGLNAPLPIGAARNIAIEDTSAAAKTWWNGVATN